MEIIKGEDLKGMKFVKDEEGRLVVYEPKGRYVPKYGEEYWFIASVGEVCQCNNFGGSFDQWTIKRQPVFRTQEECEDYKWFLDQLDKYSCEFSKEDWGNRDIEKCYFFYDHCSNVLGTDSCRFCQTSCTRYFANDFIKQFRETVGDERIKKYMFNIWE